MTSPVASAYAPLVDELLRAVTQVNEKAGAWLVLQLTQNTATSVATAFSWAARKVGPQPSRLEITGLVTPQCGWDAATVARIALLLHFVHTHAADEQNKLVTDLFYRGDTEERRAVLLCLPLVPNPDTYLLVATDSVRSHVQPVFEAIACENPYPARYFDEPAFNQMVMKAYFNGVSVARILGLQDRRNAELSRMATDFAAERNAAGRPVPPDLSLVTAALEQE